MLSRSDSLSAGMLPEVWTYLRDVVKCTCAHVLLGFFSIGTVFNRESSKKVGYVHVVVLESPFGRAVFFAQQEPIAVWHSSVA